MNSHIQVVRTHAALLGTHSAVHINDGSGRDGCVGDRCLPKHFMIAAKKLHRAIDGDRCRTLILQWYRIVHATIGEHALVKR